MADRPTRLDGARRVISLTHDRIHRGQFFTSVRAVKDLASGASTELLIVTGTIAPHTAFRVSADALTDVELFEDTTTSADGTSVPAINNNRRSSMVSETKIFHTPTITGDGSLVLPGLVLGGEKNFRVGGSLDIRSDVELILKPSSKYLIRATNATSGGGATPSNAEIVVGFYEPGLQES